MNPHFDPLKSLVGPEAVFWTRESIEELDCWKQEWPSDVLFALKEEYDTQKGDHLDLEKIPPNSIQVGTLSNWAQTLATELRDGVGFVRIAPPQIDLTEKQLRFFYLALGWAIGPTVERYGRLYDVVDQGGSYTERRIPVSQTNSETQFHTDSSSRTCLPEFIGLLCIRPAQSGGETQLVSALTACKKIADKDPDLYRELFRPLIRNIVAPGTEFNLKNLLENRIPVLEYKPQQHSGHAFRYMRYWIEKGHQLAGEPLSSASQNALNALDAELTDPDHILEFRMKASEIVFIHNFRIAHNRKDFIDPTSSTHSQRCMVRMWVNELAPTDQS